MDIQTARLECLKLAIQSSGEAVPSEDAFHRIVAFSDRLLSYIQGGENPFADAPVVKQPQEEGPEHDDALRKRVAREAGSGSVNADRIWTDVGAALDEVAAFYGLKRKGVA